MKKFFLLTLMFLGFQTFVKGQENKESEKIIPILQSLKDGAYHKTIELSNSLIQNSPPHSDINFMAVSAKGAALLLLEEYKQAIEILTPAINSTDKVKATEVYESTLSVVKRENYFIRANAYLNTNKPEKACKDYTIAEKLGHPEATQVLQRYCK